MHLPFILLFASVNAKLTFTAWFGDHCDWGQGDVRESPPDYCVKTTDRNSFRIDDYEKPDTWELTVEHFYIERCEPDLEPYAQRVQAVNHICNPVHLPHGQWRSSMMRVP